MTPFPCRQCYCPNLHGFCPVFIDLLSLSTLSALRLWIPNLDQTQREFCCSLVLKDFRRRFLWTTVLLRKKLEFRMKRTQMHHGCKDQMHTVEVWIATEISFYYGKRHWIWIAGLPKKTKKMLLSRDKNLRFQALKFCKELLRSRFATEFSKMENGTGFGPTQVAPSHVQAHWKPKTNRQTQTDRQTNRHTNNKKTDRQTNKQTDRQKTNNPASRHPANQPHQQPNIQTKPQQSKPIQKRLRFFLFIATAKKCLFRETAFEKRGTHLWLRKSGWDDLGVFGNEIRIFFLLEK